MKTRPRVINRGFANLLLIAAILFNSMAFSQSPDSAKQKSDSSRYLNRQNISSIKADRLQYMPFRSINGAALSNPNTYYLKDDRLFVDGLEATGDYVFIEGMQVANGNDFPVRAIGEYQLCRSNQPIQYGNVAGSLVEIKTPVYEDKVHFDLDGYATLNKGYKNNGVELNAGGPIRFSGKKKEGRAAGLYIASNYTFTNDENPSSETKYAATDEAQNYLTENPLRLSGLQGGGTYLNAEFLEPDDIMEVNTHQNSDRQSSNTFLKFSFSFSKNIILTLGSYSKFDWGKEFEFDNAILNSHNNPETSYRNFDNFLNFEHQFDINEDLRIGYKVNLQYSNYYFEQQDSRHKDRYFEYGYLGKYSTSKIPSYELVDEITIDGVTYENVYVLQTLDFDTAYTFQNLNYNPEAARFTEQIYELFPDNWGNWQNSTQLQMNRGLLNGQNPQMVYGERLLWNSQGAIAPYYLNSSNGYRSMGIDFGYTQSEKYRGTFKFDVKYKSHSFFAGIEYMQKTERSFSIGPMALWGKMRSLTNLHIQELDLNNPQIGTDTIGYYRFYNEPAQQYFDKNLRQKLGLPVDGLDYILTDSYDMINHTIDYYDKEGILHTIHAGEDLFTLEMFSADELLNNGQQIVRYIGYDYQGNKVNGEQEKYCFYNDRTIDAYRPSYFSAYIGDKFSWKFIDVSIGLRMDNFNANQPVLKDKYSLYEIYSAGEITELNGQPVNHPASVGDDYAVYVDNEFNPENIMGYRDGDTWFDGNGNVIQDLDILNAGSGISPYLKNPGVFIGSQNWMPDMTFIDYKTVTNLLPQLNINIRTKYGNIYTHYNSFTQNPTSMNRFRPDEYYFLNAIYRAIDNPALKPSRFDKFSFGIRPYYKNFFADLGYLGVFTHNYYYFDWVSGAYPVDYYTILNREEIIPNHNLFVSLNYFIPKSSGIGASSSLTKSFISDENRYYMNISDLVLNTHLTFNFGNGRDFIMPSSKALEAIFKNFGIGVYHQFRAGTKLSYSDTEEQMYFYTPNLSFFNLRVEKGFYIKPAGITASLYLWVENLFNKQNLFYIDPVTGEPDDDGYLSDLNWQIQINQQVNPDSYRMLYEYKLKNPDYYDIPRIVRAGLIVKL